VLLARMPAPMKKPNQRVETNRRPAIPLDAERQFAGAICVPPSLSAAVAHPCRSALTSHT
jgi:hypothetical protein